ncbi:hypothetical protein SS50377_27948 [Spironucleus salmonicida]|uniref:Myb-like DNA-binding domain-containing protein n=1 Tax=Spironucleus salmonicida TaxID=348837 RepID=A0A9P8RUX2_9EUKA|nr:hypothetical protein SS50377_27948 [Spironucleus salmonicida]
MVGKQLLSFEQIEILLQALKYGQSWKHIHKELLPQFTVLQLRNAFYKMKNKYPEVYNLYNTTQIVQLQHNDLFAEDLF